MSTMTSPNSADVIAFKKTFLDETMKPKASRLSFGEELAELGAKNSDVVALDADLSKSTQTMFFAEKFPDRFFNVGIAEANMIGVAAGLAVSGKIPFAASFGCFLTGRFDQIRMSVSFTGANVRLVGTHAGVIIGEDGHSQMALEDLTLMRSLPNMTVFQPADDQDTREFMRWSLLHKGPCYMRLTRQNLPNFRRQSGEKFAPGKWPVVVPVPTKGGVVVIGSGGVLEASLEGVGLLKASGVEAGLVNANWIKPIDEKFLADLCRRQPKLIVTVEDHYTVGGLGGVVSEFLAAQGMAPRLLRIGVDDFGQSGSPQANAEHYGFTGPKIAKRILSELG